MSGPESSEILVFQFEKPGRREDFDYPQMAAEAVAKALEDACIQHADIEQACVGYVYGKCGSGKSPSTIVTRGTPPLTKCANLNFIMLPIPQTIAQTTTDKA